MPRKAKSPKPRAPRRKTTSPKPRAKTSTPKPRAKTSTPKPRAPRRKTTSPKPRAPRRKTTSPKPRAPRRKTTNPKPRAPRRKTTNPKPRKTKATEHRAEPPATRSATDQLYKERFQELLAEINTHRPTINCFGDQFKTGFWLLWLHENGYLSSTMCIPSFRLEHQDRYNIEPKIAQDYGLVPFTKEYTEFVAALSAGRLLLTIHADKNKRWHVTGLNTVNTKSALERCKHHDIVLVRLSLKLDSGGHANAVVINNRLRTYERFEPNGTGMLSEDIDRFLDSKKFRDLLPDPTYTFVPSDAVCINLGPQALAGMPRHCREGGFCVTFSLMWLHLRMLMPLWSARDVHNMWLTLSNKELLEYALRYQGWIDDVFGSNFSRYNIKEIQKLKLGQLVSPSVKVWS